MSFNNVHKSNFASAIRKSVLDYTKIKNSGTYADGATYTVTIPVFAGEVVKTVGYYLETAFDDAGGGSSLTVAMGDGGDADGFLDATQIHLDGTEVVSSINTGAYFNDLTTDNTVNGRLYTSDDTVDIVFTPSGYSLNELTAGKIVLNVETISLR